LDISVHILPEVRGSRFRVQPAGTEPLRGGPRFKVLCCLALFIFPQIVDESTDCSTGTCGLPVNVVKLLLRYIPKLIGSRFRVQGSKVITY